MAFGPAVLQIGASAIGNGNIITLGAQASKSTVYVRGGAGLATGTIVVEEASDPSYTGTWGLIQSLSAAQLAGQEVPVHINGIVQCIRTRISVAFTVATVDAMVVGR